MKPSAPTLLAASRDGASRAPSQPRDVWIPSQPSDLASARYTLGYVLAHSPEELANSVVKSPRAERCPLPGPDRTEPTADVAARIPRPNTSWERFFRGYLLNADDGLACSAAWCTLCFVWQPDALIG